MSRIKLLLLIPHLGGGGAERVTALLAQHLDPLQFDVHLGLVTSDAVGSQAPKPSVSVHRINSPRVRSAWLQLVRLIWSEYPDIILSSMAHLNFLVLSLKSFFPSKSRIIIRQNTTASAAATTWLTRQLYRSLYPRAEHVICQTAAMAEDLQLNFKIQREKLIVLANPVDVQLIQRRSRIQRPMGSNPKTDESLSIRASASKSSQTAYSPHLLAVGRLAHEKGFDLLLRAIYIVKDRYPQIKLTIVGSGPREALLRQLCHDLSLEDHINFPGHQSDLTSYYKAATLFVLSSRHEGMPNALLEAAAAGLPLVATPCCQGILDLFQQAPSPQARSGSPTPGDLPATTLARSISAPALAEAIVQSLDRIETSPTQRFEHPFLAPFETRTAILAYQNLLTKVFAS